MYLVVAVAVLILPVLAPHLALAAGEAKHKTLPFPGVAVAEPSLPAEMVGALFMAAAVAEAQREVQDNRYLVVLGEQVDSQATHQAEELEP